jgi:hypothetical protein
MQACMHTHPNPHNTDMSKITNKHNIKYNFLIKPPFIMTHEV